MATNKPKKYIYIYTIYQQQQQQDLFAIKKKIYERKTSRKYEPCAG